MRRRARRIAVSLLLLTLTSRAVLAQTPVPAPEPAPVAPPAPGAPPEKVEEAKDKAKAAALTPIVPTPANPLGPAYQLYAELDLPILGIGLVFAAARFVQVQKAFCAPRCDPNDLNALDRQTAGYWSPRWQSASNYGLLALTASAATLLLVDEGPLPALNDAAVVAESALAATALASMMTIALARPRPFLYGDKAPLANRNSVDAGLSFLSSHAAVSFAIITSSVMTIRRRHPHSNAAWWVLAGGTAMAAFVSSARVLGGMHFITDSIGGTVVGASVGVMIPALHKSPVAVVPVSFGGEGGGKGLALAMRF